MHIDCLAVQLDLRRSRFREVAESGLDRLNVLRDGREDLRRQAIELLALKQRA